MVEVKLILADAKRYHSLVNQLILPLDSKNQIIYVCVMKPYHFIKASMEKAKIKTNNLFFIDCTGKSTIEEKNTIMNCVFLDGPEAVTSLAIAISQAVKNIKGDKVLIIDSLDGFLVYNADQVIIKFLNYIINSMRDKGVAVTLLGLKDGEEKQYFPIIESLVDEVKTL